MSTRGAYGFFVDGQEKISYNHCDSYPAYLGRNVMETIRKYSDEILAAAARRVVLVKEQARPTAKQVAEVGVEAEEDGTWYGLLRNFQGKPEAVMNGLRYMTDDRRFLRDSLFCEWAYVINLDEGTLEVYRGFNTDPQAPGRYTYNAPAREPGSSKEPYYYGVRLLETVPLAAVRGQSADEMNEMIARWEDAG